MTIQKYDLYKKKIEEEFPQLVKDVQKRLDASVSKREDFVILHEFFQQLFQEKSEEWIELFTDCYAMMPMPESVLKQIAGMLFTVNNLDPLFDLHIYSGFLEDPECFDWEAIEKNDEENDD